MIDKIQPASDKPARKLALSAAAKAECEAMVARFPHKPGALLNVLRILEREFNFLDAPAVKIAADLCGMPASKAWGTFTFYSTFRTEHSGKHVLWVCSTLPCALRGSENLYDHIKAELKTNEHGTSPDGLVTLKKAECLGACGTAPCLQLNDDYYEDVTHEGASRLIGALRKGETRPAGFTA